MLFSSNMRLRFQEDVFMTLHMIALQYHHCDFLGHITDQNVLPMIAHHSRWDQVGSRSDQGGSNELRWAQVSSSWSKVSSIGLK